MWLHEAAWRLMEELTPLDAGALDAKWPDLLADAPVTLWTIRVDLTTNVLTTILSIWSTHRLSINLHVILTLGTVTIGFVSAPVSPGVFHFCDRNVLAKKRPLLVSSNINFVRYLQNAWVLPGYFSLYLPNLFKQCLSNFRSLLGYNPDVEDCVRNGKCFFFNLKFEKRVKSALTSLGRKIKHHT